MSLELTAPHPINQVLSVLAPLVGANHTLVSARDSQIQDYRYPALEYVIHQEGLSAYDYSTKSWRVELIIELDYLMQEDQVQQCLTELELEESLAIQGLQFNLTGKLRRVVQLMVDPSSLGADFKEGDFLWSKYQFRLVRFVESAYFRKHGADEVTGASSLFVLSLLDVDGTICCLPNNQQQVYEMLKPDSVSGKLLKQKIDNQ